MAGAKCHEPGCPKNAQLVGMCIEHGDVPRVLEPREGYMTHGEIAVVLGVSSSAVWQIERRALWKLRRECKRRGITLADFMELR